MNGTKLIVDYHNDLKCDNNEIFYKMNFNDIDDTKKEENNIKLIQEDKDEKKLENKEDNIENKDENNLENNLKISDFRRDDKDNIGKNELCCCLLL